MQDGPVVVTSMIWICCCSILASLHLSLFFSTIHVMLMSSFRFFLLLFLSFFLSFLCRTHRLCSSSVQTCNSCSLFFSFSLSHNNPTHNRVLRSKPKQANRVFVSGVDLFLLLLFCLLLLLLLPLVSFLPLLLLLRVCRPCDTIMLCVV